MILVDPRAGSCELVAPLAAAGLPVEEEMLEFGDMVFRGRGELGKPLLIGIEHKKIPDLVQSLMSDRLIYQLIGNPEHPGGMLAAYDRNYLVIEGDWDHDQAGRVVVFGGLKGRRVPLKGAPLASVLEQRILTLETRGGLRVRWTRNQKETIRYVCALYRFWVDRDLDDHKSHLAVHAPDLDRALRIPLTLKRQVAAQLPGIGFERSRAVDTHFPSIWAMVNASEKEWAQVPGIGKTLAKRLVAACRGKDN